MNDDMMRLAEEIFETTECSANDALVQAAQMHDDLIKFACEWDANAAAEQERINCK